MSANIIDATLDRLVPNPFRAWKNDPLSSALLAESVRRLGMWNLWVGRETNGQIEIAFGHHRLALARKRFGLQKVVSVQCEPYTDAQMLSALGWHCPPERDTTLVRATIDQELIPKDVLCWGEQRLAEALVSMDRMDYYAARADKQDAR